MRRVRQHTAVSGAYLHEQRNRASQCTTSEYVICEHASAYVSIRQRLAHLDKEHNGRIQRSVLDSVDEFLEMVYRELNANVAEVCGRVPLRCH